MLTGVKEELFSHAKRNRDNTIPCKKPIALRFPLSSRFMVAVNFDTLQYVVAEMASFMMRCNLIVSSLCEDEEYIEKVKKDTNVMIGYTVLMNIQRWEPFRYIMETHDAYRELFKEYYRYVKKPEIILDYDNEAVRSSLYEFIKKSIKEKFGGMKESFKCIEIHEDGFRYVRDVKIIFS